MRQYISDWFGLRCETCPIATRVDRKTGGTYFWATTKEAKANLAHIKSQLQLVRAVENARFGGIYVRDRKTAKSVYEAFSKQCGYSISNWGTLLGRMIDAPSPTSVP